MIASSAAVASSSEIGVAPSIPDASIVALMFSIIAGMSTSPCTWIVSVPSTSSVPSFESSNQEKTSISSHAAVSPPACSINVAHCWSKFSAAVAPSSPVAPACAWAAACSTSERNCSEMLAPSSYVVP